MENGLGSVMARNSANYDWTLKPEGINHPVACSPQNSCVYNLRTEREARKIFQRVHHRFGAAPISRSHSPRLLRKPRSHAACQVLRATCSLRLPLLVSGVFRYWRRETKMWTANGSCSARISFKTVSVS